MAAIVRPSQPREDDARRRFGSSQIEGFSDDVNVSVARNGIRNTSSSGFRNNDGVVGHVFFRHKPSARDFQELETVNNPFATGIARSPPHKNGETGFIEADVHFGGCRDHFQSFREVVRLPDTDHYRNFRWKVNMDSVKFRKNFRNSFLNSPKCKSDKELHL